MNAAENFRKDTKGSKPDASIPTSFGLILSGGGARGAYQMGVWRALRETNLENRLSLIAGTSAGAINGAFLLQGDFELARQLWLEGAPDLVFDFLHEQDSAHLSWKNMLLDLLRNKGLRINHLKDNLRKLLDEDKIRSRGIPYGLTVWNRTRRQGDLLHLSDIPNGQLVEYIIASSSFPLFQAHQIESDVYLDGGIYSNLPLEFLGHFPEVDQALAVDVASFMRFHPRQFRLERQFRDRLLILRPSRPIPSPANFDYQARKKQEALGYLDSLQLFRKQDLV